MPAQHLTHPLDEASRARLEGRGLSMTLVDPAETDAWTGWLQAEARGFLGAAPSAEHEREARGYQADRRTTGVYGPAIAGAAGSTRPVATCQSWPTPLTVPGLGTPPAWAISSVTVAPTHRRRGIATAMLTAELRTAATLGIPLAILTVSESTIYHRFGFGPASRLVGFEIETKRERWRGRDAAGRLSYVDDPVAFRATGAAVLDRVRAGRVGEIGKSALLADRLIGPLGSEPRRDEVRLVRFDDDAGRCQGFVSYTLSADAGGDAAMHGLEVRHLASATDDAYLALWRFLVEHDLVGRVRTTTAAEDEPLPHLLSDFRRARQVAREDHLWLRVLDVPAALEARRYERDGRIVLRVADPLGFAAGAFLLDVRGGAGTVEALGPDDTVPGARIPHATVPHATVPHAGPVPEVRLDVTALGSLYLGGATARDAALRGELSGDAAALDALFRTARPPHLGSWF
ncbi:MAG: GNAT family N-acetyltransferase [Microbacteriaceae bacterium]